MRPLVVNPGACYATKGNIAFPGTQAQATALESAAQTRINDALVGATVTVTAGSIKVAT